MNRSEECRAHARECKRMADEVSNSLDRRKWLELAASWDRMISRANPPGGDEFDAAEVLQGTGQDESNSVH